MKNNWWKKFDSRSQTSLDSSHSTRCPSRRSRNPARRRRQKNGKDFYPSFTEIEKSKKKKTFRTNFSHSKPQRLHITLKLISNVTSIFLYTVESIFCWALTLCFTNKMCHSCGRGCLKPALAILAWSKNISRDSFISVFPIDHLRCPCPIILCVNARIKPNYTARLTDFG